MVANESSSLSTSSAYDHRYPPNEPDPYWGDEQADNRKFTERRKKTVRFDGQESEDWGRWDSERQGSQDSATKDSGIDTSSTFTSSEDSNRGDGPKVSTNLIFLFIIFQFKIYFRCISITEYNLINFVLLLNRKTSRVTSLMYIIGS